MNPEETQETQDYVVDSVQRPYHQVCANGIVDA